MTPADLFPLATPTQAKRQAEALARAKVHLGTRLVTHPASTFRPTPMPILEQWRKTK